MDNVWSILHIDGAIFFFFFFFFAALSLTFRGYEAGLFHAY